MSQTTHLSTMLGTYRKTEPLKQGALASSLVQLDFADVDTAQKAFKRVVRGLEFDVAELAIVTFLQAYDQGKPYLMLPFVMNGNFHHKSILCHADASFGPGELAGRKVAMRSFTQTTPTWVRGILSDDYGVKLRDVQWMSQEDPHVAEYKEPDWVVRLEPGASLEDLLVAGKVDAILAGGALTPGLPIRPLIRHPNEAALEWHRRTGVVPINHIVSIRREIADSRPDVVREVFRLLQASRAQAGEVPAAGALDLQPVGMDKVAAGVDMAIRFAHEQALISRRFSVDELYGSVLQALA